MLAFFAVGVFYCIANFALNVNSGHSPGLSTSLNDGSPFSVSTFQAFQIRAAEETSIRWALHKAWVVLVLLVVHLLLLHGNHNHQTQRRESLLRRENVQGWLDASCGMPLRLRLHLRSQMHLRCHCKLENHTFLLNHPL